MVMVRMVDVKPLLTVHHHAFFRIWNCDKAQNGKKLEYKLI
jgi:hypothetical protein